MYPNIQMYWLSLAIALYCRNFIALGPPCIQTTIGAPKILHLLNSNYLCFRDGENNLTYRTSLKQ